MGLVEELSAIGEKINEVKAASESVKVSLTFNEIPAGNDYVVAVRMPDGVPSIYSSIDVNDVLDFLDTIIDGL
jgi:hypothetical protein